MTTHQHMLDLEPVSRELTGLLDGVADDQFARPTPCEEYTVAGLLRHLLGLTVAFRDAARKDLGPTTNTPPESAPPPPIPHDWRGELRRRLDELVTAWREPAAWEGETQVGGVTLPADVAGRVALNEVLLHGWDLARATGQPYRCDEASARASMALLARSAGDAEREGTGFGPVVAVPDDAPLVDRAVALGGRSPGWSPPA